MSVKLCQLLIAAIQRLGHRAENCKMVYLMTQERLSTNSNNFPWVPMGVLLIFQTAFFIKLVIKKIEFPPLETYAPINVKPAKWVGIGQ